MTGGADSGGQRLGAPTAVGAPFNSITLRTYDGSRLSGCLFELVVLQQVGVRVAVEVAVGL